MIVVTIVQKRPEESTVGRYAVRGGDTLTIYDDSGDLFELTFDFEVTIEEETRQEERTPGPEIRLRGMAQGREKDGPGVTRPENRRTQ